MIHFLALGHVTILVPNLSRAQALRDPRSFPGGMLGSFDGFYSELAQHGPWIVSARGLFVGLYDKVVYLVLMFMNVYRVKSLTFQKS